jgi:hypothetical protein
MSDPAMARAMEADMRRRFWIALILTIPTVLVTGHVPGLRMMVSPAVANWLGLALSTPVVWYCGWVFIAGSYYAFRSRRLDMSVLIATGVLAAYLSSVYLTIVGYPTSYYEAAAMLVTFVLFGHWMEMRSRGKDGRSRMSRVIHKHLVSLALSMLPLGYSIARWGGHSARRCQRSLCRFHRLLSQSMRYRCGGHEFDGPRYTGNVGGWCQTGTSELPCRCGGQG